jgi:hypothetical protein
MKNDLEMQGMIGSLDRMTLAPKIREGLERLVRELQAVNDAFQVDLLAIQKNDLLTDKGKRTKKQSLGEKTLLMLDDYREAYREHLQQTEKKLFQNPGEVKSETEIILDQLRNAELRQMHGLATLDPLQIESKINDPGFLEAVLTSPKPLLPENRIRELVKKKAAKEKPEIAATLDAYGFARGIVKSLVSKIEADVKVSGWKDMGNALDKQFKPPVDEIADLAA